MPLTDSAENFPDLLGHPLVRDLSLRYQKTPGQLLLRFLLQLNVAVIPKSANSVRIRENINVSSLMEVRNDVVLISNRHLFDQPLLMEVEN